MKKTAQALWNGKVLAESDNVELVGGNVYFPLDSIHRDFFSESDTHTICSWKGLAHYYTIKVDDRENEDAAWYYPEPKEKARHIAGYVAFWKGVQVNY